MDICCGIHSSDQRDYTTEGEKAEARGCGGTADNTGLVQLAV